jgi:hypothetical protein
VRWIAHQREVVVVDRDRDGALRIRADRRLGIRGLRGKQRRWRQRRSSGTIAWNIPYRSTICQAWQLNDNQCQIARKLRRDHGRKLWARVTRKGQILLIEPIQQHARLSMMAGEFAHLRQIDCRACEHLG